MSTDRYLPSSTGLQNGLNFRLAAVKRKYDPDGLFFVHHGVNSEEWSADGFTRVHG